MFPKHAQQNGTHVLASQLRVKHAVRSNPVDSINSMDFANFAQVGRLPAAKAHFRKRARPCVAAKSAPAALQP